MSFLRPNESTAATTESRRMFVRAKDAAGKQTSVTRLGAIGRNTCQPPPPPPSHRDPTVRPEIPNTGWIAALTG